MITGEWTCQCGAANDGGIRYCEVCGAERQREAAATTEPPTSKLLPIHREFPERTWERSKPTDRCPEKGCGKLVSEHIAEAKAAMAKIAARSVTL